MGKHVLGIREALSSVPSKHSQTQERHGKPFLSIPQIPRAAVRTAASHCWLSNILFTKEFYIKALSKKYFNIVLLSLIEQRRGAGGMGVYAFVLYVSIWLLWY